MSEPHVHPFPGGQVSGCVCDDPPPSRATLDAERARQAYPVGLREALEAMWTQHEDGADWCGFNRATFDQHADAILALAYLPAQPVEPEPLDVHVPHAVWTWDQPFVACSCGWEAVIYDGSHVVSGVDEGRENKVDWMTHLSPDKQPKGAG